MLTEPELETRRKIWTALSDFYLDTELTEEDLMRKSVVFNNSGLTIEEIKDISKNSALPSPFGEELKMR